MASSRPTRLNGPTESVDLSELLAVVRRRWWLLVVVPAVIAALLFWRDQTRPYQVTFRATVLIPGDTEIPGNSERPELMVLDDLPSMIESRAFAELVHGAMPSPTLTVADVQSSLSGSRYSRVAMVTVTRADAIEATSIAAAATTVFPDSVNTFLVSDRGLPATVEILDPPGEPTRSRPHQRLRDAVALLVTVIAACGLALIVDRLDPRLHGRHQFERALGVPVLGDLRPR